MKRTLTVLGLLVVAIVALAACVVAAATRTGDLQDELVAEANALEADDVARPTHVDPPLPTTFGEAALPAFDALQVAFLALDGESKADQQSTKDVMLGKRPITEIPASTARVLSGSGDAVRILLRATHAARARGAPGMHTTFNVSANPLSDDGMLRILAGTKLATLEVRTHLAKGETAEALDECVDTLAVGRDASWEQGILGAMIGTAIVFDAAGACADAFDAATPAAGRDALARVSRVRAGWAPLSRAARQEAAWRELVAFGFVISPSRRKKLPADANEVIDAFPLSEHALTWSSATSTFGGAAVHSTSALPAFTGELYARWTWRGAHRRDEETVKVADLPRAARDAALTTLSAAGTGSFNVFLKGETPLPRSYADKFDRGIALVDQLRVAAAADIWRASHPEWPASEADLVEAGLVSPTTIDARTGRPFDFAPLGRDALRVPGTGVPKGTAFVKGTGDDLSFTMHADGAEPGGQPVRRGSAKRRVR